MAVKKQLIVKKNKQVINNPLYETIYEPVDRNHVKKSHLKIVLLVKKGENRFILLLNGFFFSFTQNLLNIECGYFSLHRNNVTNQCRLYLAQ